MQKGKQILAAALAGALGLGAVAGTAAAESWSTKSVKPRQAISLDVGGKHVGGYFLNAEGKCVMTLVIADAYREDRDVNSAPVVRVQLTVDSSKPARVDVRDGKLVQFDCQKDAQAMNVA